MMGVCLGRAMIVNFVVGVWGVWLLLTSWFCRCCRRLLFAAAAATAAAAEDDDAFWRKH